MRETIRKGLALSTDASRREIDGRAIAAFVLAICSIFFIFLPVVGTVLSLAALVLAFWSRTAIRRNERMAGGRLGLSAAIIGGIVALLTFVPLLFSTLLVTFF
ncbi:hypothetical protein [Microbacterium sp. cx-59]|uniref:hypothetical protein n=1 Tax=Microbacterium sp. cx-59 TaxID=2891207 RepID=UPI001E475259|nr:hypothetical protein [Microbacterium sp. cx-59]MCC4909082.1 hypothetical protein [Microbacterium sp. cx-59]